MRKVVTSSGWIVTTIQDGDNAVYLDLDNEMDMVQTNSVGKVQAGRTVTTHATLYDGTSVGTSVTLVTTASQIVIGGVTPTISISNGVVTASWVFSTSNTLSAITPATITVHYGDRDYSATFTIAPSLGSTVYQLKPDTSSIPFSRNADNTLTPASRNVGLSVIKIDGNETTEYTTFPITGVAVKYSTSSMPTTAVEGYSWPTTSPYVVSVPNTASYLYIAMFNSAGSLLDRETIPVVLDGNNGSKGANAVRIDLDNEADLLACDSTGKVRFARTVTTHAKIYDGATAAPTGVDMTGTTAQVQEALKIRNLAVDDASASGAYIVPSVSLSGGVLTVSWSFTTSHKVALASIPLTIGLKYGSPSVTYNAMFTLTPMNIAAVYQLLPDKTEIAFAVDSSNNYTPPSIDITCGYTVNSGSGTEKHDCPDSDAAIGGLYHIAYRFIDENDNPVSDASGTGAGKWNWLYNQTGQKKTIQSSTTYKDVEFALTSASGYANIADSNIIDRETVPIVKSGRKGEAGESPWVADLDNEMDSVSCDDIGKPVSQQSVSTKLSLYHGNSKQNFKVTSVLRTYGSGSTNNYTTNSAANGVTVNLSAGFNTAANANTLTITYATSAQITGRDDFKITMTDGNGGNTRELHFTVNGVVGDVYNLLPSVSEVVFAVDSSTNEFTPDHVDLTCGYKKNDKGTITEYPGTNYSNTATSANNGQPSEHSGAVYTAPYNIYYRTYTGNTISDWYWLRNAYATNQGVTTWAAIQIPSSTSYTAVEFILSDAQGSSNIDSSNIIDRETIPIIKSGKKGGKGEDGDDGINADYEERQYRNYDSRAVNSSGEPSGGTEGNWSSSIPAPSLQYQYLWCRSRWHTFDASNNETVGNWSYGLMTVPGNDGQPGATGKWYEYAGVWNVDCGPQTQNPVINTPTLGKYVKYLGNFYMNTFVDGSANTTTPGTDATKWSMMNGERKYYIAEAFFGDYAHFGRFLINGDWQISSAGTTDGSSVDKYSQEYTKFDPQLMPEGRGVISIYSDTINTYSARKSDYFNLVRGVSYTISVTIDSVTATNPTITAGLYKSNGSQIGSDKTMVGVGTMTINVSADNNLERNGCYLELMTSAGSATISSIVISSSTCFIPNYAVDGKTGRTYQQEAYIRGEVHATSGSFRGEVYVAGTGDVYVAGTGNNRNGVRIKDGRIFFYGIFGIPNIELGTDSDGCAVLRFYDKDGNFKYDLGPNGIVDTIHEQASYFVSVGKLADLDYFAENPYYSDTWMMNLVHMAVSDFYLFYEGHTGISENIEYHISGTSTPSTYDKKIYTSDTLSSSAKNANPTGTQKTTGYFIGQEIFFRYDSQGRAVYYRRVYEIVGPVLKDYKVNGIGQVYFYRRDAPDTCLTNSDGSVIPPNTANRIKDFLRSLA